MLRLRVFQLSNTAKVYKMSARVCRGLTYRTYDANGNRTSKTLNGVTQVYAIDDGDKLTAITQGGTTVKSYGYDAAGRTTSVTSSAGTTNLAYDFESRVKTIAGPGVSNAFAYNGLDTRVGKVDSGGTATYRRDGAGVTAPVLSDGGAVYTPGVSQRRSGATTFDLSDRLGTASRQTDAAKSTTATRSYDAFGMLVASSGTPKGPFGFAGGHGYQEDGDTGLKLLGHRYYDPSTGRFLTRDPAKDGRNWVAYCGNNPLKSVDPDGRFAMALGLFAVPVLGEILAVGVIVVGGTSIIAKGLDYAADRVRNADPQPLEGGDDAPADYPTVPCPWLSGEVPAEDAPPIDWDRRGPKENYRNPEWPGWYLRPDLNHPDPIGPHWDMKGPGVPKIRIAPGPWYV